MNEINRLLGEVKRWKLRDDLDTYDCTWCKSSSIGGGGYVTVYHPQVMREALAFIDGEIEKQRIRVYACAVPCHCKQGDIAAANHMFAEARRGIKNPRQPIRGDDSRVVLWNFELKSAEEHREFIIRWAHAYRNKCLERRASSEYAVFDRFNAGEFDGE